MRILIFTLHLFFSTSGYSHDTYLAFYDIDNDKSQGIIIEEDRDLLFVFDTKNGNQYSNFITRYQTNEEGITNFDLPIDVWVYSDAMPFGSFDTIPFLTTDKEWIVLYQGFANNQDDGIRTYWFSQTQDTIDEVPIFELMYNTPDNPIPYKAQRNFKEKNGKVTQVYSNGDEELYYDFNVQLGDTIVRYPDQPLFDLYVVKIDTLVVGNDNKPRKRIHLLCEIENNAIYTWVEGMGSDSVFLNNAICTILDGPSLHLRCFYENGVRVYKDSIVQDCLISSVDDMANQVKVYIYPNPASDKIYINSDMDIRSTTIYNHLGQIVLNTENEDQKMDISGLQSGIYILEIMLKDNKSSRIIKRFIKL
jgi:hypothetical protein